MRYASVETKYFRWIVLEVLVQLVIYLFTNIRNGGARGKYFPKDFMQQFEDIFKQVKKDVPGGGVPDCGTGRFSDKLSFTKWIQYNTFMWVANSALQAIVGTVMLTIGLSIYSPTAGIVLGGFLIALRLFTLIVVPYKRGLIVYIEPLSHLVIFGGLLAVVVLSYDHALNN